MPLATVLLILANILVYAIEISAGGAWFCETYGLVPAAPTLGSLASHLFVHDYRGFEHLTMNLAFLAVLGPVVERESGATGLLALHLLAGIGGGLAHVALYPSSEMPLVGASGGIYGVMALACVLRPRLLLICVPLVLWQLWSAVGQTGPEGASFMAHIGGFVVGFLVVLFKYMAGDDFGTEEA